MSASRVQLFATSWTVARQTPLSMGFPRQEYWSVLPFPSPGDLSNPGLEPWSPALQADFLPSEPPGIGNPNQKVKNQPAVQETRVRFLGWKDPQEKEMATHSSILTWKIPWVEESCGLQSMRLQRVR